MTSMRFQRPHPLQQQPPKHTDSSDADIATIPILDAPVHQLHHKRWKATLQAGSISHTHPALWNNTRSEVVVFTGGEARLYNIQSATKRHSFTFPAALVGACTNPSNHNQAYACFSNGAVVLWDIDSGEQVSSWSLPCTPQAFAVPAQSHNSVVVSVYSEVTTKYEILLIPLDTLIQTKLWDEFGAPVRLICSSSGRFVASLFHRPYVHIYDLHDHKLRRLKHSRPIRCGAFHPNDSMFGFGDESGHLCLDYNVLGSAHSKQQPQTDYHWHSGPIHCIAFSVEGNQIYTGGQEAVLVIWQLDGKADFQPRLGAEIGAISVSHDAQNVAVHLEDGAVHIMSTLSKKMTKTLQSLRGSSNWEALLAQTGMVVNQKNGLVVLNGHPGHIQFYDIQRDRSVYDVKITQIPTVKYMKNAVPPSVVTRIVFAPDSSNLITVNTSIQPVIKFWRWNTRRNGYDILSEVTASHKGEITGVAHHPTMDLVATCGTDSFFKFWTLQGK
eukprot:TRINITY_DN1585_c0_g1_i2.p1 TRINITY_DN1585_c0_g1~~TRINITY_DN1585_c0_g1_i2.p1  ORF type:complete len:498 (-),score=45.42 TRINITY_DN1585_c0_g1_i2:1106-2599(-)